MEAVIAIFILLSLLGHPDGDVHVHYKHKQHNHYHHHVKTGPCVYHDGFINIKAETTWGETIYTRFSFVGKTHDEIRARIVDEYYNKWIAKMGPHGGDLFRRKALEYGVKIHLGGDPTWDVRPIKWVEIVPYECY